MVSLAGIRSRVPLWATAPVRPARRAHVPPGHCTFMGKGDMGSMCWGGVRMLVVLSSPTSSALLSAVLGEGVVREAWWRQG